MFAYDTLMIINNIIWEREKRKREEVDTRIPLYVPVPPPPDYEPDPHATPKAVEDEFVLISEAH